VKVSERERQILVSNGLFRETPWSTFECLLVPGFVLRRENIKPQAPWTLFRDFEPLFHGYLHAALAEVERVSYSRHRKFAIARQDLMAQYSPDPGDARVSREKREVRG
jgi:hypothetical protein